LADGYAKRPAVNSNESPGKKKPKNTPFSKKIMMRIKANPPNSISSCGLNKSQKLFNVFSFVDYELKAFERINNAFLFDDISYFLK
jgi:hypothetical protein